MERPYGACRQEAGYGLIEIRLQSVGQLFNSLDPAPFHEKDIDRDAEAYIVESVRELPRAMPLKLLVHVPEAERAAAEAANVTDAIQHYFDYRRWAEQAALHRLLAQGRLAALIGLLFLVACMGAREIVLSLGDGAPSRLVGEGLMIIGWVAMWRPVEIFLYDWWPIRRMRDIYGKIARTPVEIRAGGEARR
ncbi:MAG: hypothetical protein ACK4NA_00490 [Alphaproteobacteria bacterium]